MKTLESPPRPPTLPSCNGAKPSLFVSRWARSAGELVVGEEAMPRRRQEGGRESPSSSSSWSDATSLFKAVPFPHVDGNEHMFTRTHMLHYSFRTNHTEGPTRRRLLCLSSGAAAFRGCCLCALQRLCPSWTRKGRTERC